MLISSSDGTRQREGRPAAAVTAPGDSGLAPAGRVARAPETPWAAFYPPALFAAGLAGPAAFWTCVRTRPRWEKKFAAFLLGRELPHFLPLYATETYSGRKKRRSWQPLFPGYVFVQGEHTKTTLNAAAMVVRVLQPHGAHQIEQLHGELAAIWHYLAQGISLVPATAPAIGEVCEITSGPLRGTRGVYERPGKQGRLVLIVEMLSLGTAVEVACGQVEPVRD